MSGFEAKIILDSIAPCGRRLTTVAATYPLIVHAEVMTHRDRERNAASARAIPWTTTANAILAHPFVPIKWGLEQSGMQTGDDIPEPLRPLAKAIWLRARDAALQYGALLNRIGKTACQHSALLAEFMPYMTSGELANLLEWSRSNNEFSDNVLDTRVHKSLANRLTAPFAWITVVMTATEWKNFFRLRCHPDAEIHFQAIAGMIRDAMAASTPTPPPVITVFGHNGDGFEEREKSWHLPFVTGYDLDELLVDHGIEQIKAISAARVARVSCLTHEGKRDPAKDLDLFKRLTEGSVYGHWCYSSDTEVLTKEGWMAWKDAVEQKPAIAAVDIDTKYVHFETPEHWHSSMYSGKMYSIHGRNIDLLVTPNHNMVVSYRKSGGEWSQYKFRSAEDIHGKPVRYMSFGFLKTAEPLKNAFGLSPDNFASLVGFFAGDGSAEKDAANVIYFNIRIPRKVSYLLSVFPNAQRTLSGKWKVESNGIGEWFRRNCYDDFGNKKLPTEYISSSPAETSSLLNGLMNSDGSIKGNTWIYDTTSWILASQLQAMLHINGLSSHVSTRKRSHVNPAWADCYRVNVSTKTGPRVEQGRADRIGSHLEQWVEYNGMVYCATVSTGAIIVRRNGKVIVSGNSPHGHVAKAESTLVRSGPFVGWSQFRKQFANENIEG